MKASAEKSSSTVSRTTASQPFFAKAGGGDFFAPVNRAAVPAVQAKMTVGKTGDKFEREADKMADKVMRMPSPASSAKEEKIQRKTDERLQKAAKPEEKIQKKEKQEEKIQKAPAGDKMMDKVMRMPSPASSAKEEKIQRKADEKLQKKENEKLQKAPAEEKIQKKEDDKIRKAPAREEKLQRKSNDAAPAVSSTTQSAIRSKASGGGQPLSADVRRDMEGRFNADFSQVRVHSDASAGKLSNQLSARAFTHRNHIFFSRNQYQPGTSEGKQLLAHELTHTIQQGHAVQRTPQVNTTITQPAIQREEDSSWSLSKVGGAIKSGAQAIASALDIDKIKAFIERNARSIPGFTLLTVILGKNPITQAAVSPSPAIILQGFVELLPGVGELISQALEKYGIFHKIGAWLQQRLMTISHIGSNIWQGIKDFLPDIVKYLSDFNGAWARIKGVFGTPINQLASFVSGLVTDVVNFIKDAVIRPIGEYARENISGYPLLCAIIGSDPVTGEKAAQDSAAFIGGFLIFVGQEETWENLQKANAITRAAVWFSNNLKILKGFVSAIPELFFAALKALQIDDLLEIPSAFLKIAAIFSSFAARFISWGATAVWTLLEIIFDAVAPGLVGYIKKAGGAFRTILKNPIGFVGNLVRAGKLGFEMFAGNILTHLKTALIKWLVGPLAEAGVYIPKSFSLMEIIKLVLSVLGLTWQNIRAKLVKIIPEPVLKGLEKTSDILVTLVKDGPAAAWEQIKAELSELKDQLIAQVTQMISIEVVKAAVTKLVSMLNPAGAVIQAIIAIYNTVTFFIEKAKQIGAVVASFIDSISAIAAGQVAPAAKRVEQTLANTLVVVIGFLAKFAGLGNIPTKLVGIVKKVRQPIDKGLDKIVAWLGGLLKKIGGSISDWWKAKKPFTNKAGENHTMSFSGTKESARLMISTTTMPLGDYLQQKKMEHKDKPDLLAKIQVAEGLLKQKEIVFKQGTKTKDEKQQTQKVSTALADISNALLDLGGDDFKDPDDFPEPVQTPGGVPPSNSKATFLSKAKMKAGTPTSGDNGTHGWSYISKKLSTLKGNKWVQMHLISEKLGGQATGGNLVPAPNSVNSAWRDGIESATKSLAEQKASNGKQTNVVWLSTSVGYFGKKLDNFKFANSVSSTAGVYAYKGKKDNKAVFDPVSSPVFSMSAQVPWPEFAESGKVSLNTSSGSHLRDAGVDRSIVNDIKRNRPYSDKKDFIDKMTLSLKSRFPNDKHAHYKSQSSAIEATASNPKIVVNE